MTSMVHKITAYVLVFILFSHNINTLMIISDFVINQAVIAKNFCVQKDNQQGCNGKCHLSQQIKQSTPESNTDLPTHETRRMSLDAFCLFDLKVSEIQIFNTATVQKNSFGYLQRKSGRYYDIDTPPPNFS